jgi:hypothetical protein
LNKVIEEKKVKCKKDNACVNKYANAISVLAEERTPSPLVKEIKLDELKKKASRIDRQDILDQVISELEYAYIFEVQSAGRNGAGAERLAQALQAAKDYRTGMIYIRPASTYLRSSYPAATLQGNSGVVEWENLLDDASARGLPFAGEGIVNDTLMDSRIRDINQELDKQFWVNINRVHLRGGGDTNQVVVKDDIGNWYVKGYSNDPKNIIQSARNLALFSLGSKYEADLVNRGKDAANGPGETTSLEKVRLKYKAAYDKSTEETRTALIEQLGKSLLGGDGPLVSQVKKSIEDKRAISSDNTSGDALYLDKTVDEYAKPLETVVKNLKDASPENNKDRKPQDVRDPGQTIVDALIALAHFRDKTIALIEDAMVPGAAAHQGADNAPKPETSPGNALPGVQPDNGAIETAKANTYSDASQRAQSQTQQTVELVRKIIDEVLTQHYDKRREAVTAYRQAVLFLGSAIDE